jgi:hypothetical protein
MKTKIQKPKSGSPIRKFALLVLITLAGFQAGCAFVGRGLFTAGGNYPQVARSIAPPKVGEGRVFIYFPRKNTVTENIMVIAPTDELIFAIDNKVFSVMRQTFVKVDVPAGQHTFSTNLRTIPFRLPQTFKSADPSLSFTVPPNGEIFIRMHEVNAKRPFYDPPKAGALVDKTTAETELVNLPRYKTILLGKMQQ